MNVNCTPVRCASSWHSFGKYENWIKQPFCWTHVHKIHNYYTFICIPPQSNILNYEFVLRYHLSSSYLNTIKSCTFNSLWCFNSHLNISAHNQLIHLSSVYANHKPMGCTSPPYMHTVWNYSRWLAITYIELRWCVRHNLKQLNNNYIWHTIPYNES